MLGGAGTVFGRAFGALISAFKLLGNLDMLFWLLETGELVVGEKLKKKKRGMNLFMFGFSN